MKVSAALAAGLLALTACQPAASPEPEGQPPEQATPAPETAAPVETAAAGCEADATTSWTANGSTFNVNARTDGPSCEKSVVFLTIRAADGAPVYVWSGQPSYLFGLSYATDATEMKAALAEWIVSTGPESTSTLPPWEETEGQPKRAEFPFMAPEWMDKAGYSELKAGNFPMYCFPQGMESLQCIALRDGMAEEVGLQLFPG